MKDDYVFKFLRRPRREDINEPLYLHSRNTYLHELCSQGAPSHLIEEAVRNLGADIDCVNERGLTPLAMAVREGNKEAVECLLRLGARICVELPGGRFCNAVGLSVFLNDPAMLDILLKNNGRYYINIPHSGNDKMEDLPPLDVAVEKKFSWFVKPLAKAGAFLDRESGKDKYTPVMRAGINLDKDTLIELLAMKADPNRLHSKTGMAALHMLLSMAKANDIIFTLLKWNADPNLETENGDTPLVLASLKSDVEIIKAIIFFGGLVNYKGKSGKIALHVAARRYLYGAAHIDALLEADADPFLTDSFNRTAAKIAWENTNKTNAEKLEAAMKKAEQAHADKMYRKYKR